MRTTEVARFNTQIPVVDQHTSERYIVGMPFTMKSISGWFFASSHFTQYRFCFVGNIVAAAGNNSLSEMSCNNTFTRLDVDVRRPGYR